MRLFASLFGLVLAAALTVTPFAAQAEDTPIYSVHDGVALAGFDPVSFFLNEGPQPGVEAHAVMWKGAVWLFATAQNQNRFEANPRAYAPKYGGYCALAVSQGYLTAGGPDHWEIVNGKLLLLHNDRARQRWQSERVSLAAQADNNWPNVLNR